MNNKPKKYVSSAAINFKKSRKIISVLAVFLMLSTALSVAVCSESTSPGSTKKDSKNSIKERLSQLKEKIKSILQKISQTKSSSSDTNKNKADENKDYPIKDNSSSGVYTLGFIRNFIKFLTNSTLVFYTNYSGIEKRTDLKLLKPADIDVNGDNTPDIHVKFSIYPNFKRLHFSINFRYTITRLQGFPDIHAHFEAYTEIYFPGFLARSIKGDRIRFGYESMPGDEVPDSCQLTYTFLPNILYLREKPEHQLELNPGSIVGKSNLTLLFGYTNFDNKGAVVSELDTRIIYNYAVRTKISIGGEGILGGSTFDFSRQYSEGSNVDMYCSFEKNGSTIYGYVKDLPEEVTFTVDHGQEGYLEFDTHNEPPSEIGLCDDIYNPVNKVYFTNLPTLGRIEWDRSLIYNGQANIRCYTEGAGIGINAHLVSPNSSFDMSILSKQNLDFSIFIDLFKGYFVFDRKQTDISFLMSFKSTNFSLDLSANISLSDSSPFEIYFGKLLDGNATVKFSNSSFEITDLNARIWSPSIANFTIKMDEFKKTHQGDITTFFEYHKKEGPKINITVNFTIDITNGVEISGLVIGYNGTQHKLGDIVESGDAHHFYSFSIRELSVDINISDDRSQGYICISGGIYVTFDSEYTNTSGDLTCIVSGSIAFDTDDGEFNISWSTVDGKKAFDINGTAVASISDFVLWVNHTIDISIGQLTGAFRINTFDKQGNISFYCDNGNAAFGFGTKINITDLYNVTLLGSIQANIGAGLSGYLEIDWNESGITSISAYGKGYLSGELDFTDLYFNYCNNHTNLSVSADQISVVGDLSGNLGLSPNSDTKGILFNGDGSASLSVSNLELLLYNCSENDILPQNPTQANLTFEMQSLYMSAAGFIKLNGSQNEIQLQVGGDGSFDLTYLYIKIPDQPNLTFEMQSLYLAAASFVDFNGIQNGGQNESQLQVGGDGSFDLKDVYFNFCNNRTNLSFSVGEISAVGNLVVSADSTIKEIQLNGTQASLSISDLELLYYNSSENETLPPNPTQPNLTIELPSLHLSAAGFIKLNESQIQVGGDGSFELTDFYFNNTDKNIDINASFSTDLSLAGLLTFDIVTNESIDLKLDYGVIEIDNLYFNLNENALLVTLNSIYINGAFDLNVSNDSQYVQNTYIPKINLSVGGNGYVNIADFYLNLSSIIEVNLGFFGVEFDEVNGSVVGLSLNLSDIKNSTFESFFAGGTSRCIVENFSAKVDIQNSILVNLLSVNYSGNGALSVDYHDGEIALNGSIGGGPGLIELDALNMSIKIKNITVNVTVEDFRFDGPDLFYLDGYAKFDQVTGNLSDFYLMAGSNFNIHVSKIYIQNFILISNISGSGQISAGLVNDSEDSTGHDIALAFSGTLALEKIFVVPISENPIFPRLSLVNFSGNLSINIGLSILSVLHKDISHLRVTGTVYSTTTLDFLKIENADWLLSAASFEAQPGSFSLMWNFADTNNLHLLIDNSGTINLQFETFEIENKTTGRSFEFATLGATCPHLEVMADINGDGNGYLFLDTNNQSCEYKVVLCNFINISGGFTAEDFNVSWDLSIPSIDTSGSIALNGLEVSIYFNNQWYVLLPHADFTWTPQPEDWHNIQFNGSSSEGLLITRYEWKFFDNDGWHNMGEYPTHYYNQEGNYTVTLRVSSLLGSFPNTKTETIYVGPRLKIEVIYQNVTLFEGEPFEVYVTDIQNNNSPVPDALVVYSQTDIYNITNQTSAYTNSSGVVQFTAFDVPLNDYQHYSDAIVYANKTGYPDIENESFRVYDEIADLNGYVKDNVTHIGIGGAQVVTDIGGYNATTLQYGIQKGRYKLLVLPGTYNITASKSGYGSNTLGNVSANRGDYKFLGDLYLPPLSYGGIHGFVYDTNGNRLEGIKVTVNGSGGGVVSYSGTNGNFPTNYPDPYDPYYAFNLTPGTYTVTFTDDHYQTNSTQVTVVAGQVIEMDVHLQQEWFSPNGYSDPNSGWNDETNAYDNNVDSCAKSNTIYFVWAWTEDLYLNCSQINCDKIRFYAWYDQDYCNKINISVYDGTWHNVYEGPYNNCTWVEKPLGGLYQVTKVKVKFYCKGYLWPWGTTADLYEFDFHKYQSTPS